ncbi:MAG TPA: 3-phosphoshikimate 1-carboxyvinyltransferase [Planctomycetota bacterium]|nr:3-phosphoshikimate 1-carboxyvinyltransferase [Planctomycetota bacterium]
MSTPTSAPTAPALPAELPIVPLQRPIDFDIAVPGSKSITNRYLVMSALADGKVTLGSVLRSDDTYFMTEALKKLGFRVEPDWNAKTCQIWGGGGRIPAAGGEIFVGAAGTVMRFLSAFVALGNGRFRLDGTARMRERPIEDLLQGLRLMGVKAQSEFNNGCPPVIVDASGLPGGKTAIDGSRSSQYISGMLLVAPYAKQMMTVEVTGTFVSRPFVELTLKAMSDFGVLTATEGERIYRPTFGARYRAGAYDVEGDATAASYFLAAAAILGGRCCVTNVSADSAQGDAYFADVLGRMGCIVRKGFLAGNRGIEVSRDPRTPLKAIDADLNDMPDVVLTLAVVCLFADGPSSINNVGNLRIKETDRLKALATELRRMGAEIEEGEDYLDIKPGPHRDAKIETYDDHRMAMAMSLVGLGRPGIVIKDPACVSKTYPNYFQDLERLRGI